MIGQKILKSDIERGVSTIKDKNYNPYCNGVTKFSLAFFDKVKHLLTDTYKAELIYDTKHHYCLRVSTKSGLVVSFHGCSFGYSGEGSRGSVEILVKLGFTVKQCQRIFLYRNHMTVKFDKLTLFRRI